MYGIAFKYSIVIASWFTSTWVKYLVEYLEFIFPHVVQLVGECNPLNVEISILWFQCAPTNKSVKGAAVVFSTWFCTKTMSISYFSRGVLTLMKQMQFNAEQFAHFKACVIKKKIAKVLKYEGVEMKFHFLQSWFSNHFCVNTNPFGHKIQGKAIDNLAAQAHKEKGVDLTKKKNRGQSCHSH